MIKDYLKLPWREIRRRKLRSWLTLIGIFIGIVAIVSLITLGQGLENAITQQFQSLGSDNLLIYPKGNPFNAGLSNGAIKITEKDLEVVRDISEVTIATGMIYTTAGIEYNDNIRYAFVSGLPSEKDERKLIREAQSFDIMDGRFFEDGDKYKAVLGYEYSKESFMGKAVEVGDKVKINGYEFKVIGIMEKIGSPPDDQAAVTPIDTYQEIFDTGDEIGLIFAQTEVGEDPSEVAKEVEKSLREHRDVDEGEEDFTVETPEQLMESFSSILNIIQAVLIGIAGISLLVGGVGIMNTMYTAVLQRTREIGIMKALGARNSHIMWLFLIESGLYGLGGGILGSAIGIGFAKVVEKLFEVAVGPNFLSIEINIYLILATLIFSFIVGSLSGIAPAWQASRLKPVDALRYE